MSLYQMVTIEPQTLDEKCPKCGSPLNLVVTRFGKRMKKCSTATWDPKTRTAGGCDYIEWIKGTTEPLDEDCPKCGQVGYVYYGCRQKTKKMFDQHGNGTKNGHWL